MEITLVCETSPVTPQYYNGCSMNSIDLKRFNDEKVTARNKSNIEGIPSQHRVSACRWRAARFLMFTAYLSKFLISLETAKIPKWWPNSNRKREICL